MTYPLLSIILDLVVLCFLGVTIYYAIKLTKSLNAFRQTRQEFNIIMRELSRNIDEAQRGVETLKQASFESGRDLQKIINEAKILSKNINAMPQPASVGRTAPTNDAGPGPFEEEEAFRRLERELLAEDQDDDGGFRIFDRDVEDEIIDDEEPAAFQSKAERELYEELQKKRKFPGGRMV